jgi:hypothetical protein
MEGYFPRMRTMWFNALAATAAMTLGACAAGSTTTLLEMPTGPEDAGAMTGQGDSGDPSTQSSADDSGAGVQQPSEDSGSGEMDPGSGDSGDPVSGDDSGAFGEDSGGGGEDSGGGGGQDSGGGSATDCPSTAAYALEWSALNGLGLGTSCSSGPAACPAADCCFVPPGEASEALCLAE